MMSRDDLHNLYRTMTDFIAVFVNLPDEHPLWSDDTFWNSSYVELIALRDHVFNQMLKTSHEQTI